MKYFYSAVIIATICIIGLYSYKENLFSYKNLPYDAEQENLDEQIIIHFSHVVAENTPKGMAASKFAKLVADKTDGKVVVQVYPNGILYNDDNEVEALQNNDIQMIAPTFSKLSAFDEAWNVLDIPFVIESDQQLYDVLNSELQDELFQTLSRDNMKGLDFWSNGFKQIASNEAPLQQISDFETLNIRVMKSELLEKQFKILGATPISTTFGDVFNKLEDNSINAQDNTLSNLYSKGFHTYEKNITMTNHGIMGYGVIINNDFWESLHPKYQTAILQALDEMQKWQFTQAIALNDEAYTNLAHENNVTFSELSEVTKQQWQQLLQPLYKEFDRNHYYQLLIEAASKSK